MKGAELIETKPTPRKVVHLNRDRGYRFANRDPVLDEICRIITDSGYSTYQISQRVKHLSHNICTLCPGTLNNWLSGKTRRPQNFLIDWCALACGYERKFRKIG